MPAFLKLGDIKGQAEDEDHKEWIVVKSMDSSIHRSIPDSAKGHQRTMGGTMLSDVNVVRQLDKSSVKMQEACANGVFFAEVEIHFCATIGKKQEPYLKYKLKDVILTNYSFQGTGDAQEIPMEQIAMNFTEVEWTYVLLNPKTGKIEGNIPGKYNPVKGR